MKREIFLSNSVEETLDFARHFALQLRAGHVVGLRGELGAGKTHFAKGVISGLTGIDADEVHSPTFTLVEEYLESVKLYHVDLYRLSRVEELYELPWEEWLSPPGISLIEWPERFEFILGRCDFRVTLKKRGGRQREVDICS